MKISIIIWKFIFPAEDKVCAHLAHHHLATRRALNYNYENMQTKGDAKLAQ